ncbi:MAG: hypothetical protein HY235_10210 [Acidobacteria bacterium]|nr:hypothetical protein [Acidobacteriota bacterium]
MKLSACFCVFLVLTLAAATPAMAQGMPKMTTVEPGTGKAGDELTVNGENLDKKHVAEIYLTDGKNDIKLPVVDQKAEAIKFKIPASAKPGRWALMLLTAGADPKLIEQPVKVTVE